MADANKRSAMWVWAVFATLFTAQGLVVAFAVPAPGIPSATSFTLLGFTFGFLFGAVSALSIWTALEATRYRILISLFCNLGIATLFSAFVLRTGGPRNVVAMSWATLFFLNLVNQGPLWFLRLRSGYEFRSSGDENSSEQKRAQFSIGNMLVLTTIVAIGVAAGKPLLLWIQNSPQAGGNRQFTWILMFILFSLGATTTTLGSLWFMSTRKVLPLVVAILVWMCFNAISLYQVQSLTRSPFIESCCFSITCNVVAAAMVCGPLWILDRKGRRLSVAS